MIAYQPESELLRQLSHHYPRARDERRTLLQSAFSGAADLQVTEKDLRVTLAPLSSSHRSGAIAALCDELNNTNTTFPDSSLRLRYAVRPAMPAT